MYFIVHTAIQCTVTVVYRHYVRQNFDEGKRLPVSFSHDYIATYRSTVKRRKTIDQTRSDRLNKRQKPNIVSLCCGFGIMDNRPIEGSRTFLQPLCGLSARRVSTSITIRIRPWRAPCLCERIVARRSENRTK